MTPEAGPGWVAPAILCAVSYSLSSAWQKGALPDVHPRVLPFAMFAGGLPLFAALVLLEREPFTLEPAFWQPFVLVLVINSVAYQFYVRAIRISPLSLTIPFLAFTPIFMPFTSWLILGPQDVPTAQGLAGIVLVVAGAYLLHAQEIRAGPLAPLRAIARERGTVLMLVVAFLWSFTGNLDKAAIAASSRDRYFFLVHLGFTLVFGATLVRVRALAWPDLRRAAPKLFVLGLLCGATLVLQGTAIMRTRAPYVIAVKRTGLVGSVLIGCLAFREGRLRDRLPGGAIMTAGAAIVLLAS